MMKILTKKNIEQINRSELTELIAIARLNRRDIGKVEQAFRHSTFCWFGYENGKLIAAARAISDMTFSSYLSDVVINPISQGKGYGRQLMQMIAQDLKPFGKIFIYSVPDKIGFYQRHGFATLATAMLYDSPESIERMRLQGYIL